VRPSVTIYPGRTSPRGMLSFPLGAGEPRALHVISGILRESLNFRGRYLRSLTHDTNSYMRPRPHPSGSYRSPSGGLQNWSSISSPSPSSGMCPSHATAHRTMLAAVARPKPLISCADLSRILYGC